MVGIIISLVQTGLDGFPYKKNYNGVNNRSKFHKEDSKKMTRRVNLQISMDRVFLGILIISKGGGRG